MFLRCLALAPLVLALSGCSVAAIAAPAKAVHAQTLTVDGTIETPSVFGGATAAQDGGQCYSRDGYDDIALGAQVVVTNANGDTVGIGHLDAGKAKFHPLGRSTVYGSPKCKFAFEVSDVPLGTRFYGISVGNQRRGVVQFTKAQLTQGPELTLG